MAQTAAWYALRLIVRTQAQALFFLLAVVLAVKLLAQAELAKLLL
jgi:hypothetical protein